MKTKNIVLILSSLFLLSGCNSNKSSSKESDSTFIDTEDSSKITTTEEVTTETSTTSSQTSSTESTSSTSISSYLDYYKVSVIDNKDIEISGLDSSYQEGTNVTFTISILNNNKQIKEARMNEEILTSSNNIYSFIMPNMDVTIEVILSDKEVEEKYSTTYDIKYDLGTRKTAKKIETSEQLYSCFQKSDDNLNIIESVSSFELIYGGGNGGKGETNWYKGDMLKFGTTSVNGYLSLSLKKQVNKVKLTGYVYDQACKLKVGDVNGTNAKEEICSSMNEVSKDVVNSNSVTSLEIEFEPTSNLKIETLNKKPLFLTSIEFGLSGVDANKYSVTWKNYDGTILKVDNDVIEGSIPVYEGKTPTKPNEGDKAYKFIGWEPEITKIYQDSEYTAKFAELTYKNPEIDYSPILSSDSKYIEYGFYPQSHVKDETLISRLEVTSTLASNGYYVLDDEFYIKETAKVFNNEKYEFNDGTSISNGSSYWFKCERIKWNIINKVDNRYTLLASSLLDASIYYKDYENRTLDGKDILPNDYSYSNIRSFLNDSFLNEAFAFNSSSIVDTSIEGNTDKIFLLSKEDYKNIDYGFVNEETASLTRECKTSDYSRIRGAWYNTGNKNASLKYNGTYWTRSASSSFSYAAVNINSAGFISEYAVDGTSHCIRPSINISL